LKYNASQTYTRGILINDNLEQTFVNTSIKHLFNKLF